MILKLKTIGLFCLLALVSCSTVKQTGTKTSATENCETEENAAHCLKKKDTTQLKKLSPSVHKNHQ